jgi:hypothetical protein
MTIAMNVFVARSLDADESDDEWVSEGMRAFSSREMAEPTISVENVTRRNANPF